MRRNRLAFLSPLNSTRLRRSKWLGLGNPQKNVRGRADLKFTEILDWPQDPRRKNQIVVNIGLKEKGKRFKLCKSSEQRKWI